MGEGHCNSPPQPRGQAAGVFHSSIAVARLRKPILHSTSVGTSSYRGGCVVAGLERNSTAVTSSAPCSQEGVILEAHQLTSAGGLSNKYQLCMRAANVRLAMDHEFQF